MASFFDKLLSGAVTFERGVVRLEDLPVDGLPEVAFAGRSNVGKSSLLNLLTGRRGLARTSNTPGRTQQINLFSVGGRFRLVDMPGYGYAAAPRDVVREWGKLNTAYLRGRPTLQRVLLLIDARRGLMPRDREVMALLDETAVSYQITLTKADKVKGRGMEGILEKVEEEARQHAAAYPKVLVTSSETRAGLDALRDGVLAAALPDLFPAPALDEGREKTYF